MSPKFVIVHKFLHKSKDDPFTLESESNVDNDVIMLNPRRVDYFSPVAPPTAQPNLYCGTKVSLGSNQFIVIQETIEEIKKMLEK